jgi:phenylacetate-coenzyme A ligase PaaK-like adenylate-forming protein
MSNAAFEELRLRHAADLYAAFPQYASQLRWSAAQLRTERERRMRTLLATAKERSPWHRERLRDVDAATFTEDDLPSLPTMSKDDLMDNFEAVVTDRRLTRDVVDAYVEDLPENLYLFDRYLVVASGGSSGRRGIFVYDWEAFVTLCCQVVRWMAMLPPVFPSANLWAPRGAHLSWIASQVFPRPGGETRIAPTLPLPEIVAQLNALQPKALSGYASTLALLAGEARSGRLTISPIGVATCGEPLRPEVRAEIEAVWPVHVYNYYGMSEGLYAFQCQAGDAMHLADDLHYVEPVDEAGRPVPPGMPAAKLLVTNLYNLTEPLIRYGVTDQLVILPEPCPCGVAMRRVDHVVGRTEDTITYPGGVRVHPLTIEAPLERNRHVVEYQVIQTERGVRLRFCANGPIDPSQLSASIETELRGCGLANPEVSLEQVPELSRQVSGKLKRFVPRATSS